MTGYLSLAVYILVILVYPTACRFMVRRTGARFPALRIAFLCILFFVVSCAIPPLRHLSFYQVIHALAGEYLDLFWIAFHLSSAILLLSGTRSLTVQISLITALSLFAATGNSGIFIQDLSRDGVYSLKPYTTSLISRLDSECIITWYRTDSFADSHSGIPISLVLDRYVRQNPKRLRVYERDPIQGVSPEFPEKLGLEPLDTGNYSGILIEYRDASRIVPVLAGHTLAEYELTRSIESLLEVPREYPVQVLILGDPGNGYNHVQLLLEHAGFTLYYVENPEDGLDEQIPLVVIGSQYGTVPIARSIERFLDFGGDALFMVSGTETDITGDWTAREKSNDAVIDLLQHRGIDIQPRLLRDKQHYTIIMNSLDGTSIETVPYPYWIRIHESGFLNGHSVFAGVSSLLLYWPSPVMTTGSAVLPLLQTGINARADDPPFDTRPLAVTGQTGGSGGAMFHVGVFRETGSRLLVIPDEHVVSTLNDFTAGWDNYTFFVNCTEWISGREHITVLKRREPASFSLVRRILQ